MIDVVLDGAALVFPEGATRAPLTLAGGRIADGAPAAGTGRRLALPGHLVFPGLVNAHDHLQLNSLPPEIAPAGATFANSSDWVKALQPRLASAALAPALAIPAAARAWQGGLKNLLAGVTSVAHHDPWMPVFDDPDFPVAVLRDFGWCHSLAMAPDGAQRARDLPAYGPALRASFQATPPDRPWMIHLAEGRDAAAGDEMAALDGLGCLAANTVAIHGVGLSAGDIAQVIARGAAVVWCPASNLNLLGQTLEPRTLFAAGRLALGSDSRLSGSVDLLDELRVAARSADLQPAELFRLATVDGARVLRLFDRGGLAPGQAADLLIVRDRGGDPHRQLLDLRRADIRAVFRAGAPVIAEPDLLRLFADAGIPSVVVTLDGRSKLIDRRVARADAVALEPGLELGR